MRRPPETLPADGKSAALPGRSPALISASRRSSQDDLLCAFLFQPNRAKDLLTGDGTEMPLSSDDCSLFLEKAVREGVAPLLFHQIRQHGMEGYLPPSCRSDLSNAYHVNLKRNLLLIGSLRPVISAFQSAGIPCIVLKGIVLAERIYPNIGLRGMSDVDLLIRKEDIFRADAALNALGFAPRDATAAAAIQNPVDYLASLEYRIPKTASLNLNLHLHWHPVNTSVPATAFVDMIDLNRLWESAVETEVAGCPVGMLCPERLIIYLGEHAPRVGHSFDRLILVCDIFSSIKAFEKSIDWTFVAEERRWFNLNRMVYFSLTIVKHYMGLNIPDKVIADLTPRHCSWGERYYLKLQVSGRRIRGSSYLVYLAMHRAVWSKLHFIARTFFTAARDSSPEAAGNRFRNAPIPLCRTDKRNMCIRMASALTADFDQESLTPMNTQDKAVSHMLQSLSKIRRTEARWQ